MLSMSIFKNEYIPTQETLTPVLHMEVDILSDEEQKGILDFRSPGRHKVDLFIRHTEINKSPKQEIESRQFILKGKVEIREFDKVIYISDFEININSIDTAVYLLEFEIDDIDEDRKTFIVQFEDSDDELSRYFSTVNLQIQRKLKYSLFD